MDEDRFKAAQSKLDEAVETFLIESGIGTEGMVTTGWAMVVHQHGWGENGETHSHHPIIYMGGSLPDHTALGMFQIASDVIRGVGRWGRDEDEEQ